MKTNSNRPPDTDFCQQRLKTRPAEINSLYLAITVIVVAILLIPAGTKLSASQKNVFESKITYDEDVGTDCGISSPNEGKFCQITFNINEDVDGPLYLYYEMKNFFQNHRRYYQSRDLSQLQGENLQSSDVELSCNPLYKNGSILLNPCGLIANSFFTDIFKLDAYHSVPAYSFSMDETGIAVKSDRDELFEQVSGFNYQAVDDTTVSCSSVGLNDGCKAYTDPSTGQSYLYYYPDDDTVQYLYESYPDQISPIKGVKDEHFIVWMRTASLPTFRKLYGKLDYNFKSVDKLVFNVTANYEVDSFDGTKTLLLSNLGAYGAKNIFLGQAYQTVGSICFVLGVVLLVRELFPDILQSIKGGNGGSNSGNGRQ